MQTKYFKVEEFAIGPLDGVVTGKVAYRDDDGFITVSDIEFDSFEFWDVGSGEPRALAGPDLAAVRHLIAEMLCDYDGYDSILSVDRITLSAVDACKSWGLTSGASQVGTLRQSA